MFTSAAQCTHTKQTRTHTQTQTYKYPTARYLTEELTEMKYVTLLFIAVCVVGGSQSLTNHTQGQANKEV
jgi:hypothetical protein